MTNEKQLREKLKKLVIMGCHLDDNITQSILKGQLEYSESTGDFTWIQSRVGVKKGSKSGHKEKRGYIVITINRKPYFAHRLAWLYIHGYMPKEIDHINRDKSDNRICNLRSVNRSENNFNRNLQCNNESGVQGVSFYKSLNKWKVCINYKYKQLHLGYFKTKEEAIISRKSAMHLLNEINYVEQPITIGRVLQAYSNTKKEDELNVYISLSINGFGDIDVDKVGIDGKSDSRTIASWRLTKEGQECTDDSQSIETIKALISVLEGENE